jgi:hypothetical protein
VTLPRIEAVDCANSTQERHKNSEPATSGRKTLMNGLDRQTSPIAIIPNKYCPA